MMLESVQSDMHLHRSYGCRSFPLHAYMLNLLREHKILPVAQHEDEAHLLCDVAYEFA